MMKTTKKKRVSAAGRRRIAEAQRKRWAAIRAARSNGNAPDTERIKPAPAPQIVDPELESLLDGLCNVAQQIFALGKERAFGIALRAISDESK